MSAATRLRVLVAILLCVSCGVVDAMQTATPVPRTRKMPELDWGPFYAKQLVKGNKSALGTKSSAVIVLGGAHCSDCIKSIEFYKSLMKLPGIDGVRRTIIVVARDGLNPVGKVLDAYGFQPNFMTSGPYPRRPIHGVARVPTVLVLDGNGNERGRWEGALSAEQKKAIVVALTK